MKFDTLDADGNLMPGGDRTTPERPFRFWINNDYDAVLYKDEPPKLERKICGDLKFETQLTGPHQVCEQDDYLKGGSNIDGANLDRIESVRDLEDFIPLALRVVPWNKQLAGIKIKLRAVGIRVNLFKGEWKTGSDYLTNATVAADQVKAAHLHTLDANWWEVPRNLIEAPTSGTKKGTGTAHFLLEGLSGTASCNEQPEDCYLEVQLEDASGAETVSSKTYVQLYNISAFYDHYSVGVGTDTSVTLPSSANPEQTASRSLLPDKRTAASNGDYILFVHGWRMQAAERIKFAETALKRLYWSGYQGRFGLFSWPTGWFDKPPWVSSTVEQLFKVLGNAQNFDNSEAIARRSGAPLANLLSHGSLSNFRVSVFAHSTGAVLVSEALRQSPVPLVNTYVATQGADTADAYNPAAPERGSGDFPYERKGFGLLDWFISGGGCSYTLNEYADLNQRATSTPIERYPNVDNDVPPDQDLRFTRCEIPDKYSYYTASTQSDGSPQRRHYEDVKQTTGVSLPTGESFPSHYYAGIESKTARTISYFNDADFALAGWTFNAMTKPDFLDGPTWRYAGTVSFDAATAGPLWVLDDAFTKDGNALDWADTGNDQFEIMAHIIPPRSKTLGAQSGMVGGQGEINAAEDMSESTQFGFNNEAYDHSAEFLNSYVVRQFYWNKLKGALAP